MQRYELVRVDGWKLLWNNAREFEHGESPTAKVTSFFCKRSDSDVVVDLKENNNTPLQTNITFDKLVDVSWLEERLNKTIQYKRNWNDYSLYQCVALQNYVDQCRSGGYSKAIISKQEMAMLLPKKK